MISGIMIRPARPSDLPSLVTLINRAYEVERFIFDKDRTNLAELQEMSHKGQFLILESASSELLGCVYFEKRETRGYFGMLAVSPSWQGRGFGGTLINAVDEHARKVGCTDLDLRVVSPRTELPPFYRRFGFAEIRTEPPHIDVPAKVPWHLIYMSKRL